ncbi:endolytic transglycosylase MltG [Shewanella eurypsychrophilus]|uniref:Endolytic murein transglycosylase n=1 Tax=Shewanella eurypsychrophilus TaxID=2593656 RepID=A0ABX6V859_9GAMM|nr:MULTISPECIES: endolytic transglycosylase MltG [Shewanella]QFU22457.1 endolytic transglycosylase MltG [Shewanella sp. YLB-09]QPG57744.1 endolytic transglycosylase MltG [Shewanella eurypsychrophilus]
MKKIMIALIATCFTLLTLAGGVGIWGYKVVSDFATSTLNTSESQELVLKRGTSFSYLVSTLEQRDLITDGWKLKALVKLKPELAKIRSGFYEIHPGESVTQLLTKLIKGEEKVFSVTLIEGQSIKEWKQVLKALAHSQFDENVFDLVLQENGDESGLPEGKFYPDTYHYVAGDNIKSIVQQSYKKMLQELDAAWALRAEDLPLTSPYELLIMASIIEKETGKASERPWISAVFANRLNKGMRLQTDPTVIYGMGDSYKGNITRKALREHTPFNTYRINGLTPTPIAAPSGASLIAAAQPADVHYLYFVSKNDGSHVFSKTLTEHNRAVNKYQRNR